MDESAIKQERATAKRLVTMAMHKLSRSIESGAPSKTVENNYQSLGIRMEQMMEQHAKLLVIRHPDDSEPTKEETAWMHDVEEQYEEVEQVYTRYMSTATKQGSSGHEVKKMTRVYQFEIETAEVMLTSLKMITGDKSATTTSIKEAQAELKEQLDKCRAALRDLFTVEDDDVVEGLAANMKGLQLECTKAHIEAGAAIGGKNEIKEKSSRSGLDLKMERMKMPSFSGDIRDYPRFKSEFQKHVAPFTKSEDATAYLLKSCLEKEALSVVKNVDDDLNQMWERMDDRYGRSSKLVDAIMNEIKQLKTVPNGDSGKFIELVDTVESCYLDLVRINMQAEICNSTIVSLIEERLPERIKSTWCLEVSDKATKINDGNKFLQMLEFLLKHKRAIEYGSNNLRSAATTQVGIHMSQATKGDQTEDNQDNKWCWIHTTSQHSILECKAFQDMTPDDRFEVAYQNRVCFCCLQAGHTSKRCFKAKECSVEGCRRRHHIMLHVEEDQSAKKVNQSETVAKVSHVAGFDSAVKQPGILQIMKLQASAQYTGDVNVVYDSGATATLVRQRKANELGLIGKDVRVTIVKVGNTTETINSKLYQVPVIDRDGEVEIFEAYGIPKISSAIERIDVELLAGILEIDLKGLERPTGEVDLLIGFEYAGFHPERIKSKGHLLLLENKFGRCIGGSHQDIVEKTKMMIQTIRVCHARVSMEDFFESEMLGVSCTPRCGGCRCGECPTGGKQYTIKQERELALIESGLTHDGHRWLSRYPWLKDPEELPNNYGAALSMLKSLEHRLNKSKRHLVYQEQIRDMLNRGVAERVTEEELAAYRGPVYYLSHHDVLKPDSESTPVRIVFNSSLKFRGHVLNDYWAKGPDLLNNLLGILLRFRENEVAIAGDIRKMYHSVLISELDQHTHRFIWRDMENYRKPDVYKIKRVSFGDRPAGAIAAIALRNTALLSEDEFPIASMTICNNAYVDDILGSFPSVEEATKTTEQINEVLSRGGFQVKGWTMSSNDSREDLSLQAAGDVEEYVSKVLGVVWSSKKDEFRFIAKVNFSPKHRKIRTGSDLSKADIPHHIPACMTKRMVLSLVNGIYDPLGLAAPFVVQAKMLLRKLSREKVLDWDDPMPEELREEWIRFISQLFEMEEISFQRCTKPNQALGGPTLILFSDASETAIGACAYIRWQTQDGSFHSSLLVAKSRLSPAKKTTIPRLELNGALLAARLSSFIKRECDIEFNQTYFIIDSEIVRAQIQRESYGFNTFVGVRIGEIQSLTKRDDWYWVESAKNIADLISRGASPSELRMGSDWQRGPDFLKEDVKDWPITQQDYSASQLPDVIAAPYPVTSAQVSQSLGIRQLIDGERFSSYTKLMRVTARILSISKKHSLRNALLTPSQCEIEAAERVWVQESQASTTEKINAQTMKRLGVDKVDGVYVVGSRVEKWAQDSYNCNRPVLLSAKGRLAQLYAQHIHQTCHLGTSAVAAKVQSKYWIVGLRKLLKTIQFRCITCKRIGGKTQQQAMGQLPEERTKPAPPWTHVSLDYFGPYPIRGETNKRTRGRGYGLIINCLLTRAVHLDVVSDYGTSSFLMALRRFMSIRGSPKKVYSDQGTQLRAADKELKEVITSTNERELKEFSANHSFDWEFCAPDAPWQNGCSEALIKSVKKSIKIAIGDQALTYSELQTVLMECANLLNDRPIGRHPTQPEDGRYLSPNDLLLGHSTITVPHGPFDMTANKLQRFKFVQKIADAFWKRWMESYFPSLLIQQKWHTSYRNVKKGDIVLVQDSNLIRGKWRLGRVIEAEASLRDGFVRNIKLQYKNAESKNYLTMTRPVQRIIVLLPIEHQ